MIKLQEINFPIDCKINQHDFYSYDPSISFNEADSVKYLSEDLLQCSYPVDDLVIDLGWYGDVVSNKGEFRIYIVQNENWDFPFNVVHSKSLDEITNLLTKILQYYTRSKIETAPNFI